MPQQKRSVAWHSMMLATVSSLAAMACIAAKAQDRVSDSGALFARMATVFQHPRCMNCHTNTDFPTQGDDRHRHTMNVARGADDRGAAGLHCQACHQTGNQAASGVPGAPDWHLAPLRMGWEGLSARELCAVVFDPARGGMKPADLVAHFETGLVRWAWTPGTDSRGRPRSVPSMTHDEFIALTRQWLASGGSCPR